MNLSSIKASFSKRPFLYGGLILLCLVVLGASLFNKKPQRPAPIPLATQATLAVKADVPRFYHGLGTVTALQDTVVRSRVEGHLTAIHFKEGQYVHEGDTLVEIDPRPFQNKLAEAKGALIRDEALLKNARQDLERYKRLLRQDAIPVQQVQAQEAVVGQYEGTVIQDKAAIAEAELQLSYSKVSAPFAGKTGLRQVDIGATISPGDSAGIVRLTQTQPCYVVFTLVDKYLPHVRDAIHTRRLRSQEHNNPESHNSRLPQEEGGLTINVWSQDGKTQLSAGHLESLDNQIDLSTGTIKAKALIPNDDNRLYPNQFVNVQLHVDTLRDVITVPAAAIQRNNTGYFVYVIIDDTARLRPITLEYSNDALAVIASGLDEGDLVITDGVDNLRDGSPVRHSLTTSHTDTPSGDSSSGDVPVGDTSLDNVAHTPNASDTTGTTGTAVTPEASGRPQASGSP